MPATKHENTGPLSHKPVPRFFACGAILPLPPPHPNHGSKHNHTKGDKHPTSISTSISISISISTDAGEVTPPRTGTPGYLPVELLWEPVKAGPENDVFSFAVLVLEVLILPGMWENNLFAHSVSQVKSSRPGNGKGGREGGLP